MSLLFKDSNNEIGIMINSIRNDLLSRVIVCQSLALTLACNLGNSELLKELAEPVENIITNYKKYQPYTLKKALICYSKVLEIRVRFFKARKSILRRPNSSK